MKTPQRDLYSAGSSRRARAHRSAQQRIGQVGWLRWLIEEQEKPSWDHPEWIEWTRAEYEAEGRPTLADLVSRF